MENNKTIEERIEKDKSALIEILKEMPVIQVACQKAGISRATYYRWRNEDDNFSSKCDESLRQGIEFVNDMSELQKIHMIKEKKMTAITWWDKHNNPKYGAKRNPQLPNILLEKLTPKDEELFKKLMGTLETESVENHDKDI